jgi:hypothetical protein
VPAEYVFRTTAGRLLTLTGQLRVAQPTAQDRFLPSLLGWDVLEHFRLVLDRRARLVELRPPGAPGA